MAKWQTHTLRLKPNHGWKCKPGYKIFVAERGAVRFDIPTHWHMVLDEISVKFHDLPPPRDNCRLEVSYLHLPPGIDYSGLSVSRLLKDIVLDERKDALTRSEIVYVKRPDLIEYAWADMSFLDPNEHREGCTRACMARGFGVQPFITLDYWPEDAARFLPVWEEVMRSLQLGQYVKDPTRRELH